MPRRGPLRTGLERFPFIRLKQALMARWQTELSLDAAKMRCRKRRTSVSTWRQSTPSQPGRPSSGPFTTARSSAIGVAIGVAVVSNLSLGSDTVDHRVFAGSPDARQRSFEPNHYGVRIRAVIRHHRPEDAVTGVGLPGAFRRPGLGLLRHPFPAEDFSFPHSRPTRSYAPGPQRDCHVPQV